MKTIGDLREFCKSEIGSIQIGKNIKIGYSGNENSDIDIYINGRFIAWIKHHNSNDTLLKDADTGYLSEFFDQSKTTSSEQPIENAQLTEIDTLTNELNNANKELTRCAGKIEVFEQLLLGRNISIEK